MVGILNRVGMIIATGGTVTVTASTLISDRFNTPAEAGAVDGQQYYWILEEDLDYEIFIGTWTLSGTTVSRDTVLSSKIAGVHGTTKMTLLGSATLRSAAPAEVYAALLTSAGGTLTGALNWATAATVASATTTDIGAAASNLVNVTGTTPIAGLGTIAAGAMRWVKFAGILTLTHHATSLINIGGANITTAANDIALFVSEGSGNWRMFDYTRADGSALAYATTAQFAANTAGKTLDPAAVWGIGAEVAVTDGISGTATFSNGSANITITTSLAVDAPIHFTTSGALPTNFAASTEYYVLSNSGTVITVAATRGGSAIVAGSAGSGTQTLVSRLWLNGALGNNFVLNTIGGNRTLAKPHNFKASQPIRFRIIQDGTGSRTLSVPAASGYKYIGTSAPTLLSTAAGADDTLYMDPISATDVTISPVKARTAW